MSYAYYYGYNCYGYGCLSQPPGAQLQDPNPLPDIEVGGYVPPTTYTSTQQFTALCPAGTVPMNTVSNIPVLAAYNDQGYVVDTTGDTPGFEAWRVFGAGPGWRTTPILGFFVAVDVEFVTPPTPQTFLTCAVTADSTINGVPMNYQVRGSNDGGATFTTLFQANNVILATGQQQNFTFTNPGTYGLYQLTMQRSDGQAVLVGLQKLQYFLPCPTCGGVTKSATATSQISQANADSLALTAATLDANTALAQIGCATQYSSTQTTTVKCAAGQYDGNNGNGVTASGSAVSYISQAAADASALALATANANLILTCNNSNNTTPVSIPAPALQAAGLGQASPFPTVKFVSGLVGHVTRIQVNLLGLIHQNQSDINMLLVGPSGQKVVLMCKCGGNNALVQTDITLDSNSVTALPQFTTMVAGSFKPTSFGTPIFDAPAPQTGYAADFTGIVGQAVSLVNGSWSLWIQDAVALDVGGLNNGFTLVIDAS